MKKYWSLQSYYFIIKNYCIQEGAYSNCVQMIWSEKRMTTQQYNWKLAIEDMHHIHSATNKYIYMSICYNKLPRLLLLSIPNNAVSFILWLKVILE